MKTWPKKLVTIVTEKILEDDLTEHLKKLQVKGFTITDARGEGSRGVRSAAWDQSSNIRIEIVCDDKTAERVCESFQQNFYDHYAMIIFVSDVMTLRNDKF
jgi:nitrogen regulatory protein PII